MNQLIKQLEANDSFGQADAVRKTLQFLYSDEIENFRKNILTVDMWGGYGAVWEVGNFPTKESEKEFQINIIKLVDLMKSSGIRSCKAEGIAKIFRKEIKKT